MTIERKAFLYEILIRFDSDGLKGIHAVDLERIVEGDTLHAENALPARPVTPEELAGLIDEKATALFDQVSAARAAADEQRARADAAEERLAEIIERATALAQALAPVAASTTV
jgi:esterase/lipase superfamily enzyme